MKLFLSGIALAITLFSSAAAQSSSVVRLEGQVVCCEDCWAKADRKTTPYGTRADLEQAAQCVGNGDPTLLAVANSEGGFTMYQLESGKFKRPGKNWLEFVGRRLEVTGSIGKKKNANYIRIDTLTVLAEAIAANEPEVNVTGTEAELTLKDLSGVEQRLSGYRGRIVVLNFWATYCVPCRRRCPTLPQFKTSTLRWECKSSRSCRCTGRQTEGDAVHKRDQTELPCLAGCLSQGHQRLGLGSILPGTVVIGRDGRSLLSRESSSPRN
jgi:hypothetical protein